MKNYERVCESCSLSYTSTSKRGKYCSKICWTQAAHGRYYTTVVCEFCSHPMEKKNWLLNHEHHFCSNTCLHAGFRIPVADFRACTRCHIEKPFTEFYLNHLKTKRSTFFKSPRCRDCYDKTIGAATEFRRLRKDYCSRSRANQGKSVEHYCRALAMRASGVAKTMRRDFNLDADYVLNLWRKQGGRCALSGEPMTFQVLTGRVHTNGSIDRIDSRVGYIKGNVQLVCSIVNIMKNTLSTFELVGWCGKILTMSQDGVSSKAA